MSRTTGPCKGISTPPSALEIRSAEKISAEMHPWSCGTERARARILSFARQVLLAAPNRPEVVIALLSLRLGPATVVAYAATLQAVLPLLKGHTRWRAALRWARKVAACHQPRQALPATPTDIAAMLRHPNVKLGAMALTMYLSASRHADVAAMVPREESPMAVLVDLLPFKSDIFHRRFLTKALFLPPRWHSAILRLLHSNVQPSYREMLTFVKECNSKLTVHSLRRGAVTTLSSCFQLEEIVMLTLHTMPMEPSSARRYISPSLHHTLAMLQLRMSRYLWEAVRQAMRE